MLQVIAIALEISFRAALGYPGQESLTLADSVLVDHAVTKRCQNSSIPLRLTEAQLVLKIRRASSGGG